MIPGKTLTLASLLLAATLVAALAGACGSAPTGRGRTATGAGGPAVVAVVAAESQYGDVAAQVGGPYVRVRSIMDNPDTDPHSFEVSTRVARAIATAGLVVQNGLGYDGFMGRIEGASPDPGRRVVDARTVLGLPASTANPHLWYDPATMPRVADAIAADLAALQPAHASYFRANAARFRASLTPWLQAIQRLRSRYPGFPVATTEPVADYLLSAVGARDLTPFSFQADVMNGVDPAPQGIATETDLLQHRRVRALVYNRQVTDSLTSGFVRTARRAGVAVVGVDEIMPAGESYQAWMLATTQRLEQAVSGS